MGFSNFFSPQQPQQVQSNQDYDLQMQAENERKKRAFDLLNRDRPPVQGAMVGGRYIKPSFSDSLVQGLRDYGAFVDAKEAEKNLANLSQQKNSAVADALRNFTELSNGTQERIIPPITPNDDEGFANQPVVVEGKKPDMAAAYQALASAPDARLRDFAVQSQLSQAAEQAKIAQQQQERAKLAQVLRGVSNPQQALQAGVPPEMVKQYYESQNWGKSKVDWKDVGGKLMPVTEYGESPQGIAPMQKTGDPFKDLLVSGENGQIMANSPLIGAKAQIAAAGKPQISVDARNFNTQESEQSKAYGKALGETRAQINQAGFEAPSKLAKLSRMEQLLSGVDGGGAAPAMADIASFANSLGIKIDPKLGNKQAAEALSREIAGTLRQPGTGPTTEKDFDNFMKQVPGLSKTAEGRAQIISTMRSAIERDQRAAQFAREYAKKNNGIIDDNFFDAMSNFYAKNPIVTPQMPSTNSRGQPFSDPAKEQRYQEWLKTQGAK